jgi:hypothetical protein
VLFAREAMRTDIAVLPACVARSELAHVLRLDGQWVQMLFPIVDARNRMVGVLTRRALQKLSAER